MNSKLNKKTFQFHALNPWKNIIMEGWIQLYPACCFRLTDAIFKKYSLIFYGSCLIISQRNEQKIAVHGKFLYPHFIKLMSLQDLSFNSKTNLLHQISIMVFILLSLTPIFGRGTFSRLSNFAKRPTFARQMTCGQVTMSVSRLSYDSKTSINKSVKSSKRELSTFLNGRAMPFNRNDFVT